MKKKPEYMAINFSGMGDKPDKKLNFIGIDINHVKSFSYRTRIGLRILWILGVVSYWRGDEQNREN